MVTSSLSAAWDEDKLEAAAAVLSAAAEQQRVHAAVLYVRQGEKTLTRAFGAARSVDAIFLLASIAKPISVAALMSLYDRGEFGLDDPVKKFIPEFHGKWRDQVTIRQLLTHTSGLPDQLAESQDLRARHAELSEFVKGTIHTPMLFAPDSHYSYSSMGILLASEIARRITGVAYDKFVDAQVYQPLGMKHSALGLGKLKLSDTVLCQTDHGLAGDPMSRAWDRNSPYWRGLGAPWGGAHGSAGDVARFLAEFLHPSGIVVRPETARRMRSNQNPARLRPHGLGLALGKYIGGLGCSERTFGHAGITGTLAWADPATDTIFVVLTTLPLAAEDPHPRAIVSDLVVEATRQGI